MTIWTKAFWKGAAERAVRAFCATLLIVLVGPNVTTTVGVDVLHVGWRDALSFALGAALISVLVSVAVNVSGAGPVGSASAVYDRPRDYGLRASDGS